MPYSWHHADTGAPADTAGAFVPERGGPARCLVWPHQSLSPQGFVWFIGITAGMFCFPLVAVLGTFALWGLLPFLLLVLWGVWFGIQKNARDLRYHEELVLTDDRIAITRHQPRGGHLNWEANPYWVELALHPKGGPVENYITLRGSDRIVELGAFLSPEERLTLHEELQNALVRVRSHPDMR